MTDFTFKSSSSASPVNRSAEDMELESLGNNGEKIDNDDGQSPPVPLVKDRVFGKNELSANAIEESISKELKGNNLNENGFQNNGTMMEEEKCPASPNKRQRTCSSSSHSGSGLSLNVDCSSPSPSPISIGSPASRLIQIRREESVDEVTREIAKERDITAAYSLSRSLDETTWLSDKNFINTVDHRDSKRDSLDEMFNPSISSPVRFIDKIYGNRSLTPSPIAVPISPKQRTFRRSLSPSNLRPSVLSSKRKLDTDENDCSPAKRLNSFYSPVSILSSISSSSSPDLLSDSNRFSNDDDSGNEHAFLPQQTSQQYQNTPNQCAHNNFVQRHSSTSSLNNITPLSCDTRPGQPFVFVKPKHFAPQSPLAAGVTSSSLNTDNNRKSSVGSQGYTFTPVKD